MNFQHDNVDFKWIFKCQMIRKRMQTILLAIDVVKIVKFVTVLSICSMNYYISIFSHKNRSDDLAILNKVFTIQY